MYVCTCPIPRICWLRGVQRLRRDLLPRTPAHREPPPPARTHLTLSRPPQINTVCDVGLIYEPLILLHGAPIPSPPPAPPCPVPGSQRADSPIHNAPKRGSSSPAGAPPPTDTPRARGPRCRPYSNPIMTRAAVHASFLHQPPAVPHHVRARRRHNAPWSSQKCRSSHLRVCDRLSSLYIGLQYGTLPDFMSHEIVSGLYVCTAPCLSSSPPHTIAFTLKIHFALERAHRTLAAPLCYGLRLAIA
ncbi:hypothetical protein FB451DRAFT_1395145 [Mycena latifolia]|nr:hypothetical protein FB451DRAFT_1395145 [Mycena latifolia]